MIEIRMDGPGKNALGTALMTQVLEQLKAAGGQPVLLTGAGDAFSAGLNLKEVAAADGDAMFTFLGLLEELMTTLFLYPGPTVAAVNGHAIAGGCVLTLFCDHRVMTSNGPAKIGLNETALGVRFPPRTFAGVRRRVPSHQAERVLLGADLYNAPTALALGLIDEIAENPVETAKARLAVLANHPSQMYALTKGDIRGTSPSDLCPADVHERTLREASVLWSGSDVKSKILSVLGK